MGIATRIQELLHPESTSSPKPLPLSAQTEKGSIVHVGAPPADRLVDGEWADQSNIREETWQLEKLKNPLYHVAYVTLSESDAAKLETVFGEFFQNLDLLHSPNLDIKNIQIPPHSCAGTVWSDPDHTQMVGYWAAIAVTNQPSVYELLIQVNPEYRQKGVATTIARAVIEILKTKSAQKIQAVIKSTNNEVIALIHKIATLNNLELVFQINGTEIYYEITLT